MIVRGLGLTKEAANCIDSRLKEKNLLAQGNIFYWYRIREMEWDNRNRVKYWPKRQNLEPGTKIIFRHNLVKSQQFLLPPLHIKSGICTMKQFVKALDKNVLNFRYFCYKYPILSEMKLK